MRLRPWQLGLFLIAATGLGRAVNAQQPKPVTPAPSQPTDTSTGRTASQDPLLTALTPRLRHLLEQEHFKGKLHFEDDVLVAEVNTHHARLHLSDKTGHEAASLSDMTVPDANGWRMELQVLPGNYIGQMVRPQTLTVTYHDQAGKAVGWTEYLGKDWLKAANKSLMINISYGKQVKSELLEKLKTTAQSEAEKAATP